MKSRDAKAEEFLEINESDHMASSIDRIQDILSTKYEAADLEELVAECKHLTKIEQQKLLKLLKKYESLFDGTLGKWTGEPYELELKAGAQPYHTKPYPIPKTYEQTLKLEVDRLCDLGVLKR